MRKEEELKKKFDEAEKHYHGTVDKARKDSEEIKQRIVKEAEEMREKTITEAQQQSEDIIRKAEKTNEMLKREIEKQISKAAIEKACELVQQTLPSQLQEETHTKWIEGLIEGGMEKIDRMHIADDVKHVEIISAMPLKTAQKADLKKKLKEKLKKDFDINEKTDPKVVAGMRVKIGSVILDGTLFNKIKEAAFSEQSTIT
jgi:F0F1-type ATP synthase delta subunit